MEGACACGKKLNSKPSPLELKSAERPVRQLWQDRALFRRVICWTDVTAFSGDYIARPSKGGVDLAVIP